MHHESGWKEKAAGCSNDILNVHPAPALVTQSRVFAAQLPRQRARRGNAHTLHRPRGQEETQDRPEKPRYAGHDPRQCQTPELRTWIMLDFSTTALFARSSLLNSSQVGCTSF